MAALTGGATIHSSGEVPIGEVQASAEKKKTWDKPDVSTMFVKRESMRVLIVDEGSSASGESLSTTELNIRTATRDAAEHTKSGRGRKNSDRGTHLRRLKRFFLRELVATPSCEAKGHQ